MEAPTVSGIHVTATNKSAIANVKMYQFAIFRSPGFLEIAATTKQFPRMAVMLIKMNIVDSVAMDKTVRSDMADADLIYADNVSVGDSFPRVFNECFSGRE